MPSTRNPVSLVNPGPGKLPTGVGTASALLFQTSNAGATAPLYSPKALPKHNNYTAGGGGDASKILTATGTAWLWMGDSVSILAPDLFLVSDQNDHPLWVGSTLVKVTGIAGAAIGDGFVAGPITLTFNVTIPAATTYRIYYAVRGDLATAPTDVWSEKTIRNSAEGSAYLFLDSTDTTKFTNTSLVDINTKSGGVGQPVTTAQKAFENIDSRLTKLRAFTATISDNVNSFGGDHNNATLDTIVDQTLTTLSLGTFSVRSGTYKITNAATAWDLEECVFWSAGGGALINLDSTRTTNLPVSGASLRGGVFLDTASTSYQYEVVGDFDFDGMTAEDALLGAGAVLVNGQFAQNRISFRNFQGALSSVITTANACLEITGKGQIELSNIYFDVAAFPTASAPTAMLYIHDTTLETVINVQNCQFRNDGTAYLPATPVHGVRLDNVKSLVKFTNCQFVLSTNDTGDSFALSAIDCAGVIFENCLFQNDVGQVIRATNSGITFINCAFQGGFGSFGVLTSPQLICGEGYVNGTDESNALRFVNCAALFGTDNVKPSYVGAGLKPIIELGGHDGISGGVHGQVHVDGLYIESMPGLNVHNFTTVVLRSDDLNREANSFKNLTIDMKGAVPTNSGTISAANTWPAGGGGHILEVVSETTLSPIVVKNLNIVGVGTPAVAVPRSILCAGIVSFDGVMLKAAGTGGAGYYGPICQFLDCNVNELVTWPDGNEAIGNDVVRISGNFVPSKFTDCRIAMTIMPSPSVSGFAPWALNLENNTSLVFENCLFFNSNGQAVRNVNTGATYINCKFESGVGTALSNPQLICGEGYTRVGTSRFGVEPGGSVVAGKWHDGSPPSASFVTAGVKPGDWLLVNPLSPASGLYQITDVAANDLTLNRPIHADAGPSDYEVRAPGTVFGYPVAAAVISDNQADLRIVNCDASFGSANIVCGTTDIHQGSPIVELGGHAITGIAVTPAATAFPGHVEVDGLTIKPTTILTGESGTGASLGAGGTGEMTLTGLSGMTAGHKGKYMRLSGASQPNNNGVFLISTYVSATSVKVTTNYGYGFADAGSISWEVLLGVHNYTTVLFHDYPKVALNGGSQTTENTPNRYSNVTVDMLGTIPNNYGGNIGLASYNYGIDGDGARIIQIAGAKRILASGAAAAVSAPGGSGDPDLKSTITGLTGVTPLHVGLMLRMTKTTGGLNNGVFQITDYVSSSSVKIFNPNGSGADTGYAWSIEAAPPKCKVENLRVVNVGRVAGAGGLTSRGIIEALYADIYGLVLDGTPFQATRDVTGSFAKPLIKFRNVTARDLQIFPTNGLLSTSSIAKVIDIGDSSHVFGVRYHNRGTTDDWTSTTLTLQPASGPLFTLGLDSTLDSALVLTDVNVLPDNLGSAVPIWVSVTGNRARLSNSSFYMASYASVSTTGWTYMVQGTSDEVTVTNNTFRWNSSSGLLVDMIDFFLADRSVFTGNSLLSTGTQAPNPLVVGAGCIDLNVENSGANAGDPAIF